MVRNGVLVDTNALIIIIIIIYAIALSPGGSSPTLVETKIKIHKTT